MVRATSQGSDQPVRMRSLIRAFGSHLNFLFVKLLTEFPSLKEDCTGSAESTLVKMPHCWKAHAAAQIAVCIKSCTVLLSIPFCAIVTLWS